ncbi:DUF1360 domain-containing protein [Priestia flexa]|uniref:DUF1360 domain-containing protein n=1 Tax=Priestia TaxID=2800373 RepID=UPI00209D1846|nr:DUF1360 domain-containing protein [Priestia flexa]MCP1188280.1 DUF1360 domain-containing protein [Priestia flexa]MDT2048065.1 DUF1360 domain-containing protein [Priestia flexa]USY55845.1 DUF1360 domain-containing protein [Bacillus sp. 1780r2a1]
MTWIYLFLFVFATFRLTRLIVFDKITGFIRQPFHEMVKEVDEQGNEMTYLTVKGKGLRKWIGELLSCYWCTGMWCAIAIYAGYTFFPQVAIPAIIILAIAGCAGIIESFMK